MKYTIDSEDDEYVYVKCINERNGDFCIVERKKQLSSNGIDLEPDDMVMMAREQDIRKLKSN